MFLQSYSSGLFLESIRYTSWSNKQQYRISKFPQLHRQTVGKHKLHVKAKLIKGLHLKKHILTTSRLKAPGQPANQPTTPA